MEQKTRFSCENCRFYTNNKTDFNRHVLTRKHEKNVKNVCEICGFLTNNKTDLERHKMTLKHKKNVSKRKWKQQNAFLCEYCNKEYKTSCGLWKHNKNCNDITGGALQHHIQPNSATKETTLKMQENNIIKIIVEQNQLLQQQIKELLPKIGNNNNSNNKININNIQIFLNEDCKDALNLTDFVNSLNITLEDLLFTKDKGLISSTQNVIVNGLKSIDRTKRPIHCIDEKRKIMYVKEDGKWDKDRENKRLKESIQTIAYQQSKKIPLWEEEHPQYKEKQNIYENYIKLVAETHKDINVDDSKMMETIIKTISKETKWESNGILQ